MCYYMCNVHSHCSEVVYDVNSAQFIHSTTDEYLHDCLGLFWSSAMNILGPAPWCTCVCVSIVHGPRSRMARSQVCVCYVLVHTAKQFSKMTVSIYSTLSTAWEFCLLYILGNTSYCQCFSFQLFMWRYDGNSF